MYLPSADVPPASSWCSRGRDAMVKKAVREIGISSDGSL